MATVSRCGDFGFLRFMFFLSVLDFPFNHPHGGNDASAELMEFGKAMREIAFVVMGHERLAEFF